MALDLSSRKVQSKLADLVSPSGAIVDLDARNASTVLEYPPVEWNTTTGSMTLTTGSYGTGAYVASASSALSEFPAYLAFESTTQIISTDSFWHSLGNWPQGIYNGTIGTLAQNGTNYMGEWLQIELPHAIKLSSFSILPRQDNGYWTSRSPSTFVVLGSNDGTAWNLVDSESGVSWTSSQKTFSVTSNAAFRYYRLVISISNSDSIQISRWRLYGTPATVASAVPVSSLGTFSPPNVIQNGLIAWFDPNNLSSYSGSGASLYNLIDGTSATIGGTYNTTTGGIRLVNTSVNYTANVSYLKVGSLQNITTISLWYYQHSNPNTSRFLFDTRTTNLPEDGFIYSGNPNAGSNWSSGTLYKNGGSSQIITWANIETVGSWQNITVTANISVSKAITIFGYWDNLACLDVTFGPILIYNRIITQAENESNFNAIRTRYSLDGGTPRVTVERPLTYATGGFNNGSYISTVSSTDSYYGNTFRISGNTSNNGEIYFNSSSNIVFYIINRSNSSTFAFNQATTTWLTERSFTYTQLGVSASSPFEFLVEFTQTHFIIKKSDGTFVGIYTNVIPNDRIISTSLFGGFTVNKDATKVSLGSLTSSTTANINIATNRGLTVSALARPKSSSAVTAATDGVYPPVAMSANTSVISGQSVGNGSYTASSSTSTTTGYLAFDKNLSNPWSSGINLYDTSGSYTGAITTTDTMSTVHSGEWVQLQLPNSIAPKSFTMTVGASNNPTTFALLGSNTGSTWDLVYNTPFAVTLSTSGSTFLTNSINLYNYFRLIIKSISGSSSCNVYEMSLTQSGVPRPPLTIFDGRDITGAQRIHLGQQATFIHPLDYIETSGIAPIVITETNGESFTTLSGSPTFTWDSSQVSQTLSKTSVVLLSDATVSFGNNATRLTYQFVVPVTTTYKIQLQVLCPNGNNDSMFVNLNGSTQTFTVQNFLNYAVLTPSTFASVTLSAGTHTLVIQARERSALGGIIIQSTNNLYYGTSVKNEHLYAAIHNGDSVYPRITSFAPKRTLPIAPTLTGNLSAPTVSFDVRSLLGATTGNSIFQFSGFTQGTVTAQPTYSAVNNPYNGLPYLSFNRTNSQFLARSSTTLNIQTNGGFTAMALVRFTGSVGVWERIFDFGSGAANNNLVFARSVSTNNLHFAALNASTEYNVTSTTNPIVQGEWAVFGCRYNGTTRLAELFKNGTLVGSTTFSAAITNRTTTINYIGRSNWGQDAYLNGDLASLYAYDRFLSDADLTTLYSLITTPSYSQALQYDRFQRYTLTYNDITGDVKTYINNNLVGTDTAVNIYPPQALTTTGTVTLSGSLYGNGSYVASASSSQPGGEAYLAFNKINDFGWQISSAVSLLYSTAGSYSGAVSTNSYLGEWIQLQLPVSIRLSSITMTVVSGRSAPNAFKIFGSTDGNTWVDIYTGSSSSWPTETNRFSINNSTLYNYFRLVTNTVVYALDGRIFIRELNLFGTEQITNKTLTTLSIGKSLLNAGTTSDLDISDLRVYDREVTSSELSTINNVATKPKVITSSAITNVSNNAMGIVSLDPKSMNFDDGTPVAEWNGFSQSTDSRRPIYRGSGGYNNGPYLEFKKGSKQFLSTSAASINFQIGSNGGFTIAGIARFSGDTPTLNERIVELNSQNSTSGYGSAAGNLAITRAGTDNNLKITSLNIPSTIDAVSAVSTWTTRASAANNSWTSVVWAPELGIFVAVSETGSGNRVMTSPDGITWTSRVSAADNNWRSVTWSPELSLFVAVAYSGTGNRVMTSSDGLNWVTRTSAADNSWYSVTWSSQLAIFVATAITGSGNRVMTSSDGIVWTTQTSAANNSWNSVIWVSELGLFVAVAYTGTGNRVMTSPDGINWTTRASAANNQWYTVAWSPKLRLLCAVADTGTGNRLMTSSDGITWTTRSVPDNPWSTISWSQELSLFIAIAYSNGSLITSFDGITWTTRTSIANNAWSCAVWSPELGIFVITPWTGTGNSVMTSTPMQLGTQVVTTNNLIYKNEWVPFAARYNAADATLQVYRGTTANTSTAVLEYPPAAVTGTPGDFGYTTTLSNVSYGNGSYTISNSIYLPQASLSNVFDKTSNAFTNWGGRYDNSGNYLTNAVYPPAAMTGGSTTFSGLSVANGTYTVAVSSTAAGSAGYLAMDRSTTGSSFWSSATGVYNTSGSYIGSASRAGTNGEWISLQSPFYNQTGTATITCLDPSRAPLTFAWVLGYDMNTISISGSVTTGSWASSPTQTFSNGNWTGNAWSGRPIWGILVTSIAGTGGSLRIDDLYFTQVAPVTTTDVSNTVYSGEWLQIQLPNPISLKSFSLTAGGSNNITQYTLLGSTGGSTWNTLYNTNTNITLSTSGSIYNTNTSTLYAYYRLIFKKVSNGGGHSLGEFRLFSSLTDRTFTQMLLGKSSGEIYSNMDLGGLWMYDRPLSDRELRKLYNTITTGSSPDTQITKVESSISETLDLGSAVLAIDAKSEAARPDVAAPILEYPPDNRITGNITQTTGTIIVQVSGADYGNGIYTFAASSVYNSGVYFPPSYLFESITQFFSTDSFWATDNLYNNATGVYTGTVTTIAQNGTSYQGEWVQIGLSQSIVLSSYIILPRQHNSLWPQRSPNTFVILGSNDGLTWNLVDMETSIGNWTSSAKTFTVNSSVAYRLYRMIISVAGNTNQTSNRTGVNISRWRLYGSATSTSSSSSVSLVYPPAPLTSNSTAIASTSTSYAAGTYTASASTTTTGSAFTPFGSADSLISGRKGYWESALNFNSTTGGFATAATTWVTRSAPDFNWTSVCWSSELSLFAASGWSGYIMTSPDAITWTTRVFTSTQVVSIIWVPELTLFVGVSNTGTGNRVVTSPDGITWTTRTSAADNSWNSVVWAPELRLLVAVATSGTGNRVMTSPDGIVWVTRISVADNNWNSVTWSPELSLFVAIANSGTGNRVMTSNDGITWTTRTSAADNFWASITWSSELSLFVVIGSSDTVMTSSNGITWTTRSSFNSAWNTVIWTKELGLFIAVAQFGTGNRVMTSLDGIIWTTRSSATDNNWKGLTYSPQLNLFVAVADTGTGNRVMTSGGLGNESGEFLQLQLPKAIAPNSFTVLPRQTAPFDSASLYLPFDNSITDRSTNGNLMTMVGTPRYNTSAVVGTSSLYLENETAVNSRTIPSNYLTCSSFTFSNTFTVSMWSSCTSQPTTVSMPFTTNTGLQFLNNSIFIGFWSSNVIYAGFYNGNQTTSVPFTLNTWYHLAITYNNGTLTFFANGINIGTCSGTLDQNGFMLGNSGTIRPTFGPFAGYIDDFTIYNRVLTAAEIASLSTPPSLRSPRYFLALGSTNGSNWDLLYRGSDVSWNTAAQKFPVVNAKAAKYNYFRLLTTRVGNGNVTANKSSLQIAGLTLEELIMGSTSTVARAILPSQIQQADTSKLPRLVTPTTILEFPPRPLTANTTTVTTADYANGTYIASASGNLNMVWYPFDSLIVTAENYPYMDLYWTSPGTYNAADGTYAGTVSTTTINGTSYPGEWLQISLPTKIRLTSFTLKGRWSYTLRNPKNFVILGSNDGTAWNLVGSFTNVLDWGSDSKIFTVSTTNSFSYYRIVTNALNGARTEYSISRWQLFGTLADNYLAFSAGKSHSLSVPSKTYDIATGGGFTALAKVRLGTSSLTARPQKIFDLGSSATSSSAVNNLTMDVTTSGNLRLTSFNIPSTTDAVTAVSTWTTRASVADNSWRSICWSPELSIFVAVAHTGSGNRVMTSSNGITWISRVTNNNNWLRVVWAAELGLFVAVASSGTGNRVMTSNDGITWVTRTSAADNQWQGITWAPELGLFVAISDSGTGNRVMTSSDGITWTTRTSAADNSWYSITWSKELRLFVVVGASGSGNRVMTSSDGINWTTRTSAADNSWLGVTWAAELGLFVAVSWTGSLNRVMTSSDGITWMTRSTDNSNLENVTWAAELGLLVVMSWSGRIITSSDGINWTTRSAAANNQWIHSAWAPELGIFAAVSNSGTGNRVMTTSSVYKGINATSSSSRSLYLVNNTNVATASNYLLSPSYKFGDIFTVSLWALSFDDFTSKNCICFSTTTTTSPTNTLFISFWAGRIYTYFHNANACTGPISSANTWYNISVIYNNGTLTLFVNGVSYGSCIGTLAQSGFMLGNSGNTNANAFAGYIDNFTIYNRVLAASEISYLAANPSLSSPLEGAAVYLPFDGTISSPGIATRLIGTERYGPGVGDLIAPNQWLTLGARYTRSTAIASLDARQLSTQLVNSQGVYDWSNFYQQTSSARPTYISSGGYAGNPYISFNRTNSQFLDRGSTTLNIATNGGFTALALVRFTGTVGLNESIFDFSSGTPNNNLFFGRNGTTGNLFIDVYNSTGQYQFFATTTSPIVQGEWAVFGYRYNGSTRLTEIFKNGTLVGSTTLAIAITDRTVTTSYIGRTPWGGVPYTNMDLSALYVYDSYLKDSDLQTLTQNLLSGAVPLTETLELSVNGKTKFLMPVNAPVTSKTVTGTVARAYTGGLYPTFSNMDLASLYLFDRVLTRSEMDTLYKLMDTQSDSALTRTTRYTPSATRIVQVPPATSQTITSNTFSITDSSYANGTFVVSTSSERSGRESYRVFNYNSTDQFGTPSGTYNTTTGSQRLNLDLTGTGYLGSWIRLQMPYNLRLTRYQIKSTSVIRSPRDFALFGSTDNINWTKLDDRSNISFGVAEEKVFTVSTNTSYRYLSIIINRIGATDTAEIDNLKFFGVIDPAPTNASLSARYLKLTNSPTTPRLEVTDILNRSIASNAPVVRNDILKNFVTPMISSPLASRNYTPIQNGLVAWFDPNDPLCYSGSGATMASLVGNVNATMGGTYSYNAGTVRLFNNTGVGATNTACLRLPTLSNISSISLWFYEHGAVPGGNYMLETRPGGSYYIYNRYVPSTTWYLNGGSGTSGTGTISTNYGVWKNLTIVPSASITSNIILFGAGYDGLDVTFGPVLVYNRVITQAENEYNFNAVLANYFSTPNPTLPITNGLTAWFDPSDTRCYPGSGATLGSLVMSGTTGSFATGTLSGTYSYDSTSNGIRLVNTLQLDSLSNITTVSIWYKQESIPPSGRYLLDGRIGGSGAWIYNGSDYTGTNWTTGTLYKNGGTTQSITWDNIYNNSLGTWQNITLIANTPFTDDLTLFGFQGGGGPGLDVTFGPILIYNRALTESENRINYEIMNRKLLARASQKIQPSLVAKSTLMYPPVSLTSDSITISNSSTSYGAGTYSLLASSTSGTISADGLINLDSRSLSSTNGASVSNWEGFTQGTLANQPVYYNSSGFNNMPYLSFNRTNSQFLNRGSTTLNIQTNGGFTALALVRFTGTAGAYERIFDFGSGASNNNIQLYRNNTTGSIVFGAFNNTTGNYAGADNVITQNEWVVVGCRYNTVTGLVQFIKNGTYIPSSTFTQPIIDRTVTTSYIGRSLTAANAYTSMDLSGLYIYDRALSDVDLATAYNNLTSYSLSYNAFDGTGGSMWSSSNFVYNTTSGTISTNGVVNADSRALTLSSVSRVSNWSGFTQGTLANQPFFYKVGGYNGGPFVRFNSANVNNIQANTTITPSGGITILMLFKFNGPVVSYEPLFYSSKLVIFRLDTGSGIYVSQIDDTGTQQLTGYPTVSQDTWTVISYRFNSSTKLAQLYRNNSVVASGTLAGTFSNFTIVNPIIGMRDSNVCANIDVGGVYIYNTALSDADLTTAHNNLTSYSNSYNGTYTGTVTSNDLYGNSYSGEYLQFKLPDPVYPSSLAITPDQTNFALNAPTNFTLLGSSNDIDYTQILTTTTSWASSATQTFRINGTTGSSVPFNNYRLVMTGIVNNILEYPPIGLTNETQTISGYGFGDGSYTITSSSTNSSYPPYNAFRTTSSFWISRNNGNNNYITTSGSYGGITSTIVDSQTYSGEWIQIQLPSSISISSFKMGPRSNSTFYATASPRDFILAGSNDGTTWNLIYTGTNTNWSSASNIKTFTVTPVSNSYRYWRIVIMTIGNLPVTTTDINVGLRYCSLIRTEANEGAASITELQVFGSPVASSISVQQFPPSSMTANTTAMLNTSYGSGTYIASASSNFGSSFPWRAFDNNISTSTWVSQSNLYDYASGFYIGTTTMTAGSASYTGEWLQIQTPNPIILDSCRIYPKPTLLNRAPVKFYIFGSNNGSTWNLLYNNSNTISWNTNPKYFVISAINSYTYFRLLISSIGQNQGVIEIAEWNLFGREIQSPIREFPPGPMTWSGLSTTFTGYPYGEGTYIASASSTEYNTIIGAFDKINDTNNWQSAWGVYSTTGSYIGTTGTTIGSTVYNGEWLQIQLPNKILLKEYEIQNIITNGQHNRNPSLFYMAGSNDGSTWTLLDTEDVTSSQYATRRFYIPQNTQSFNYYRLIGNRIYAGGTQQNMSCDLVLYGEESAASTYTVTDLGSDTAIKQIRLNNDVSSTTAPLNILGSSLSLVNTAGTETYTKALDSQKEIYTLLDTTYTDAYSMTKTPFSANFLSHNESVIAFDSKYTGTYTNDSSSVPFGVRKTKDTLALQVGSQSTSGTLVTWSNAIGISNSGGVAFGSGTAVSRLFEGTTSVGGGTIGPISIIAPTLDGNLASPVAFADVRNLTGFTTGTKVSSINSFTQTTGSAQPTFSLATPFQNMPYMSFDRTNSQFLNRGSTTLNIATNGGFTALALVRFTGAAGNYERIFDFGNGENNNNIALSRIEWGSGLRFYISNGSSNYILDRTTQIIQNTWQIFACRYNASNNFTETFVNGIQVGSGTSTVSLTNRTSTINYVGRSHWSTDAYSNMDLASLYAYDRALSDVELDRLYRSMITPLVRISIGRTLPSANYLTIATPEMNTGTETVDHTVTTKTTSTFDVKLRRSDGSSWTNNLTINWKLYQ